MTPLTGDLGVADLAVLERWADPNVLVKQGAERVTARSCRRRTTTKAQSGQPWLDRSAEAHSRSTRDHPAVAFVDLAAEVATEVRLLRAVQCELTTHAARA